MSNRLLVNPGTPQAWAIELKPGLNRLGSDPNNDFTIQHSSISAFHCELEVTDAGVMLRAIGSASGVFVERVAVQETKLYSGQLLQIGAIEMVLESKGLPVLPDAVNLPGDGAHIMVANPGPTSPIPPRVKTIAVTGTEFVTRPEPLEALPVAEAKPSLPLSVLGSVCGGLLGVAAWYLTIKFTGAAVDWLACGVGGLAGLGGRFATRQASQIVGITAGLGALLSILIGFYLASHNFNQSAGIFSLLWLFLGTGIAYKTGAGHKE